MVKCHSSRNGRYSWLLHASSYPEIINERKRVIAIGRYLISCEHSAIGKWRNNGTADIHLETGKCHPSHVEAAAAIWRRGEASNAVHKVSPWAEASCMRPHLANMRSIHRVNEASCRSFIWLNPGRFIEPARRYWYQIGARCIQSVDGMLYQHKISYYRRNRSLQRHALSMACAKSAAGYVWQIIAGSCECLITISK